MSFISRVSIALALATLFALAQTASPSPRTWIDLFHPPYDRVPQLVLGIGCVSGQFCVVPTLQNGAGPNIMSFDGQPNGFFATIRQANDTGTTFAQYVGVGGTVDTIHGAVAGVDFGALPRYIVNKSFIADSLYLPFVGTVSISADRKTGKTVAFVNEFGEARGISISQDGGETYATKKMTGTLPTDNCTFGMYQSVIDSKNIFVTFGSNPKRRNGHHQTKKEKKNLQGEEIVARLSSVAHVARHPKTGALRHVLESPADRQKAFGNQRGNLKEVGCPYSAAIMKTSDGGDSWTTVYSSLNGGFQMNNIDCINATHCVATAEGFEEGDNNTARVFVTTDGSTFTNTLTVRSAPGAAYYMSAVSWVPGKSGEVWVAVTEQSARGMKAIMYGSFDGGRTWPKKESDDFIGAVTGMSFAADGQGFASCVTALRDSTILKYNANGAPATPAPAYSGNVTEKKCVYATCSGNCTTSSFAQHTCRKVNELLSEMNHCDLVDNVLVKRLFIGSDSCDPSAARQEELLPLNQCLQLPKGASEEVRCG